MPAAHAETAATLAADLSAELRRLAPHGTAPEPPIRSLSFDTERFEQHGRRLAGAHEVVAGDDSGGVFVRLNENTAVLGSTRAVLARRIAEGTVIDPGAVRLVEDAPLIDVQLEATRTALKRRVLRQLPRLRDQPLAGLPRVYGIAWAWVAHADSRLEPALLGAFLGGYQARRPLKLAECRALPGMLRVVLIENLRRLSQRAALTQVARDAAHAWIDADAAHRSLASLDALDAAFDARGLAQPFRLTLHGRVDDLAAGAANELAIWLARRLPDRAVALARQQRDQEADRHSIAHALDTLGAIDRFDWRRLFEAIEGPMRVLIRLPCHAAEHEQTQDATCRAIERLAQEADCSETRVAEALVTLASEAPQPHVVQAAPGYWHSGPGLPQLRQAVGLTRPLPVWRTPRFRRRGAAFAYFGSVLVLSTLLVAALLAGSDAPGWLEAVAAVLLWFPISQILFDVADRVADGWCNDVRLPRLALPGGIGDERRTLVVMPVTLTHPDDVVGLAHRLERHAIANREPAVQYALLSDWPDAATEQTAADASLLDSARAAVDRLNQRHPPREGEPVRFLLLHRTRRWSETERRWTGWERRRGQLEQLIQLLADGATATSPFVALGPLSEPAPGVQHLVTLDAGTLLQPGALRALVGTAAHPLNRPQLNEHRRVIGGWTILQPRVEPMRHASQPVTWYDELLAGRCADGDVALSSRVHQRLFGEGTHTGSGLIDVAAARATLVGRLPEAQVSSHAMLTGAMARCADVGGVVLLDERTVEPDASSDQVHHATRGAWQLLPFIRAARRHNLSRIGCWKLVDGLRRSLVAPMSLLLLLLVFATGIVPVAAALAVVAAAGCTGALTEVLGHWRRRGRSARAGGRRAGTGWCRLIGLAAWQLAMLLHQALLHADAIGRALHRHFISRRRLLRAPPEAPTVRVAAPTLPALLHRHAHVPVAAAVIGFGLWLVLDRELAIDTRAFAALFALWGAAPMWIWRAGRHRSPPRGDRLDGPSRLWLDGLARDTWRFHEHLVGAADHHLPPASVQYLPRRLASHQTSPSAIGSYLLATTRAQALGFIGREEMVERLTATLDTLERLPRHRGHWLSGYDTRSLEPHAPATISTVESGILCVLLVAVSAACETLATTASTRQAAEQALRGSGARLRALGAPAGGTEGIPTLVQLSADQAIVWPRSAEELTASRAQVQRALGEFAALQLELGEAGENAPVWLLRDHAAMLDSALRDLAPDASASPQRLLWLAERCRQLALAPDFSFLHDSAGGLLHRRWLVDAQRSDGGHHELLASEARLASLFAIAKGDVPATHWHALGRPMSAWEGTLALRSAAGSMAEYLVPALLLAAPRGSLLEQAAHGAVLAQRAHAQACGSPWGESESATAGRDADFAYRHAVHGVATLALHAASDEERVIAPHASAMALPIEPAAALANLRRLQALGARGAMGFIDALDYTPRRQVHGGELVSVVAHVATHQAFSLIAMSEALIGGTTSGSTMGDALLGAVLPLMHEHPPRDVPPLRSPALMRARERPTQRLVHDADPRAGDLPRTQLLSNGRHALVLRDTGAGFSSWSGVALTRWRDDLPCDDFGLWFYVRRGDVDATAPWLSLTARPAGDPAARYRSRAHADRTVAEATWPDLRTRCTAWVAVDVDCELRQIELHNTGRTELQLTLASFTEVALQTLDVDDPDPALAPLFVQAHWSAPEHALHFRRKPRSDGERAVHAVHFLGACSAPIDAVRACADRARWIGASGSLADPRGDGGLDGAPAAAFGFDAPGEAADTGFAPVASIAVTLRIAPGATVRLTYGLAAAWDAAALVRVVDRFRSADALARASDLSVATAAVHLERTGFDSKTWGALLHANTCMTALVSHERAAASRGADARPAGVDRRVLLRRGIDGASPIVLVSIRGETGLPLLGVLKKALAAWQAIGTGVDLVVLHPERATGPARVLELVDRWQDEQAAARQPGAAGSGAVRLHLLDRGSLDADELHTLRSLARLHLHADGRSLAQQIGRWVHARSWAREKSLAAVQFLPVEPQLSTAEGPTTPIAAPAHAFDESDGSLRFLVDPSSRPSRRWVNLLANPVFSCRVTEFGSADCRTSGDPPHPISGLLDDAALDDAAGEWLLLHDLDRGSVWPLGRAISVASPRDVAHAPGRTTMRQRIGDIEVVLTWSVDPTLALRQLVVELRSHAASPRRIRLVSMVEWTLGAGRGARRSVSTRGAVWTPAADGEGLPLPAPVRVLQATQNDRADPLGGSAAFLVWRGDADAATGLPPPDTLDDWTCDRTEFFAPDGRCVLPLRLGRRDGAGLDPCAGLACTLELGPGAATTRSLLLGHASSAAAAIQLLKRVWRVEPAQRLQAQQHAIRELTGRVRVKTPDPAFDALVNHWLPYQTLVARRWVRGSAGPGIADSRTARDALQDAAGLINHAPELLAQQIRVHAARPAAPAAPRAAVAADSPDVGAASDQWLWLPWACALYRRRTGDASLLDERVPVADGATGVSDRAALLPDRDDEQLTIYEHAARAIDCSLRTGKHGLPLIGTGDWNEAMDRVGHLGRGESVWLAWFACAVVGAMLPIAASRGDAKRVAAWTSARRGWRAALETQAWDGQWYLRGFFDDGSPIGSASAEECRIDLSAQAWAVLSGAGDQRRATQALASAERVLHDLQNRLVRVFDPPLQEQHPPAGSVQRYPAGVRWNGAQDNCAAVWMLMALAEQRDAAGAWRIFTAISPAHRWSDPAIGSAYALEPFALAESVCSRPPHTGRGMTSWDGAAPGWLLRAAIESICGIALAQETLAVRPGLPPHWPEIEVTIRNHGRSHRLIVCADAAALQAAIEREAGARRIAVGETLALDRVAGGSVHIVDAAASAVAARQDQFEEGAFTVARTADE